MTRSKPAMKFHIRSSTNFGKYLILAIFSKFLKSLTVVAAKISNFKFKVVDSNDLLFT